MSLYKCLYCHDPHLVTDKGCPSYPDQITVIKIAALRNISSKEVENLLRQYKRSTRGDNSSLEMIRLFPRQELSTHTLSIPALFNYSDFLELGNVNLDSPTGTSTTSSFTPSLTP